MVNNHWLVVTGTHGILNDFPYIGNHISIDELIFFRGVGQQPTTICWVKSVKSTTSPCDISPEAVRGQAWSHQSVQLGRQVPSAGKADLHQTAQGGR
jgi:hypothetical protein